MKRLRSPEFLVLLAPFILLAPVLFGNAMFWGTPALQFHPWHVAAWETLKSGHLPLWNPLSGMGAPLIANYQSALFYPPNWLYFLLGAVGGEPAMAWGMGFLSAAHLALAGLGMVRLTRTLGLGTGAQIISGLAFGLSGYLVSRSHFLSINVAVPWLPWILWAGYEMVVSSKASTNSYKLLGVPEKKGSLWELVGVGGNSFLRLTFFMAMLLLAGHAQTAWYTLLLTGLWLLFWVFQLDPRPSAFVRVLSFFALAGLAAVALAAVQLIPTAELLSQSQRAGGADYDFVMTYSFWPWRLIGLVAPGFFGSPATGDYWGYGNFWEDMIYVGVLPFLLVVRAVGQGLRKQEARSSYIPLIRFLLIMLFFAFLLALGQNTPIFPFLYRYIPTFDLFQAPTRWMVWGVFALALLAGIGAETWQRPVGKRARGRCLRGVVIAAAILIAALAAGWVIPGIEPSFIRATALAGGLGIGAGLFTLFAPKSEPIENMPPPHNLRVHPRSSASNFSLLAGAFVALDLIIAGWGLIPDISLDFYRKEGENTVFVRDLLGEGRLFLPASDEYDLTFDRYLRFDTFHTDFTHFRATLLPNLTLLEHLPSANNYDPLRLSRYVQWLDALETADPAQQRQMLAMMGVTVVARYVPESETGVRFEVLEAHPRFQWFPCAWSATDGDQAWALLFDNPPELERAYVVLEGYATDAQWVCSEGDRATIHLISEHANEIRLQVEADSSGWLMIADTWYPGWTAEVNGEAVQVYRANHLFRAVQVPAGGGEVVLQYRPAGFWVGVGVSGVAWGLCVWGGLNLRNREQLLDKHYDAK